MRRTVPSSLALAELARAIFHDQLAGVIDRLSALACYVPMDGCAADAACLGASAKGDAAVTHGGNCPLYLLLRRPSMLVANAGSDCDFANTTIRNLTSARDVLERLAAPSSYGDHFGDRCVLRGQQFTAGTFGILQGNFSWYPRGCRQVKCTLFPRKPEALTSARDTVAT